MDSHASRDFLFSEEEEEEEENNWSSENGDLEVEEIDNASGVDVFVDEEDVTNPVHWSSTLNEINFKPFFIPHGRTKDLGPNAKSKDYYSLFIDDNFLDEIAANSIS